MNFFELRRLQEQENAVAQVDEAKKKIHSVSNGKLRADVIKLTGMDDEGDPFIVKLFKNGKHHEPADYYTDDKSDAIGTAKMMVKEDVEEAEIDEAMQDTFTVQFPELKKKVPVRARNSQEAIKKAAKRVGVNWKTVKLGKVQKESVEVEEARAPQLKKASMKGATASGVRGKHLKTYEITMMAERGGIMFRVVSDDGDIRTMNAAALAKLL